MKILKWLAAALVSVAGLVIAVAVVVLGRIAGLAQDVPAYDAGTPVAVARPVVASAFRSGASILYGDLHVHTTFSTDGLAMGTRAFGGEGAAPPADACDFARFCSQLDFWSINDHAEGLTQRHWQETQRAIRACNASAGDPRDPDMVSFLGWEWSQAGSSPTKHFGHKNVVLLDQDGPTVPARPIAASNALGQLIWGSQGVYAAWGSDRASAEPHRYWLDQLKDGLFGTCDVGVPSRDLPLECREVAPTPADLFAKLDEWNPRAIVIPHGLSWGVTNMNGIDLRYQVTAEYHNPKWQRLIEVYSGHGNSEVFSDFESGSVDANGNAVCPEPTRDFEACCWRAGELARDRCEEASSAACAESVDRVRAEVARQSPIERMILGLPLDSVPGTTVSDYGDCGELKNAFLPASGYKPLGSAQYGLTVGSPATPDREEQRWRLGFMAASDNHSARAGPGYKEFGRFHMTDGRGMTDSVDRARLFYYTGGLTAVHAQGRDRQAIFDALDRRETYGTSGDRIALWFDWIAPDGTSKPMGSEIEVRSAAKFTVRAVGAFEQKPGCPDFVHEAMTAERITSLCLGECFHPGEQRKRIERIEVVRIRPQVSEDERAVDLIEDPWRTIACDDAGDGCKVTFEDSDYSGERETLYYVRAIQEPSPVVNADPLRCEYDEEGRCTRSNACAKGEACVADAQERAWSSPIWLLPPRG